MYDEGERYLKFMIALPSTAVAEANSLLEKTIKVGLMARALSIFKVSDLFVYRDESEKIDERDLLGKLFNYIVCPQYLRKKVFPLDQDLKCVGILPPLNTPNHPTEKSLREVPEVTYREGLVMGGRGKKYLVDVGLDEPLALHASEELRRGERIILKIVKREENVIEVCRVKRSEVPYYFGFEIHITGLNLGGLISSFRGRALIIATSRYGKEVHKEALNLMNKMKEHDEVLLLFGSPFRGLYDIAKSEGFNLDDEVDMVLNFIPDQGTKTVRVEEALYSTLAIINFLYHQVKDVAPRK